MGFAFAQDLSVCLPWQETFRFRLVVWHWCGMKRLFLLHQLAFNQLLAEISAPTKGGYRITLLATEATSESTQQALSLVHSHSGFQAHEHISQSHKTEKFETRNQELIFVLLEVPAHRHAHHLLSSGILQSFAGVVKDSQLCTNRKNSMKSTNGYSSIYHQISYTILYHHIQSI